MPLIKCPECGREISDKAECCPGCGCPSSEWKNNSDNKSEISCDNLGKPERDYVFGKYGIRIEKANGRFTVFENDSIKCDCSGSSPYITNIFQERGEDIYSFWTPGINPIVKFIPENKKEKEVFQQLFFDEIQNYLNGNKEKFQKKTPEPKTEDQPIIKKEPEISPYALRCPSCKSINLQIVSQEVRGARDAKTKTTTSLNLNPLKPFTLFNHKEKVVKKARAGSVYVKWRCADCGHMFERKES